jgi:Escherichia/Staphylococcus phage prohead protease
MNDDRETRVVMGIEIRAGEDGKPRLIGYASVFNTRSEGLPFVEIVRPGAFRKSLDSGADVVALVEHEVGKIIGRRSADTLTVNEDERGLRYEVILPDTQAGRDVAENVRRGDIKGSSFGFRTRKDRWDYASDPMIRELLEVDILDVAPTAMPAYPKTDVALRSLDNAKAEASKADEERIQAEQAKVQADQDEAELEADARARDLRLAEIA